MADLTTSYLGLNLKNPIIAGSSGLTNSMADLIELEKAGAGAIVLKSLFEEEIRMEMEESFNQMTSSGFIYPETMDYFDYDAIEDTLSSYLKLIRDAKEQLSIPVIASVNCVTSEKWTHFSKELEKAGADALELNVFLLPSDFTRSAEENETIYFDIIKEIKQQINIPISLKVSYYFSNLGSMLKRLSESGIQGLTLFNRFYSPDFDLDRMTVVPSNVLSNPAELSISLRWVAIMAERVKCNLAASTGIHDGAAVIKQILAGADVVHIASTLYKNGAGYIQTMLEDIEKWMVQKEFTSLADFKGKMSQSRTSNPASLERVQFMKNFRDR